MKITKTQAQDIIKRIDNGLIFTVTFVKRTNGAVRVMNCRKGVKKGTNGRGMSYDAASKGLIPVFDMQTQGFRVISLESILSLSVQGQKFIVS